MPAPDAIFARVLALARGGRYGDAAMIIARRLPPKIVMLLALRSMMFAAPWAVFVFALYAYCDLWFLRVPFLPVASVGTAVAFYVGFKNNAAYERFWEGRRIWGGIVNASRSWAVAVLGYVDFGDATPEATAMRRQLVLRHLAWVNALRLQLRKTSRFFVKPARSTKLRLERHAEHMRNDWDRELSPFIGADELRDITAKANGATALLATQTQRVAELARGNRINHFQQVAMMELVTELFALQGQCERIKNTPFPRLYAEYSRVFTYVFTLLVPFGLLDVFAANIDKAMTMVEHAAPVLPMLLSSCLIAWVFTTMEGIGDASEDPFERSMNDVPMNALSRTIEIDLRQMIGDPDVPPREQPIDDLLY